MTVDQAVAEGPHNHPPRCCCEHSDFGDLRVTECPACPEHGTKPDPIGCPQCHEPIGRPHTDYCTLAPGEVWDGVLATPACRHMQTRRCPWPQGCGALCARLESDDPRPWT